MYDTEGAWRSLVWIDSIINKTTRKNLVKPRLPSLLRPNVLPSPTLQDHKGLEPVASFKQWSTNFIQTRDSATTRPSGPVPQYLGGRHDPDPGDWCVALEEAPLESSASRPLAVTEKNISWFGVVIQPFNPTISRTLGEFSGWPWLHKTIWKRNQRQWYDLCSAELEPLI